MRAAVLAAPRELRIERIPRPEPIVGTALVRVEAVGLCGTDVKGFLGEHPRVRLPTVLGHELAGTVVAVGPDVDEDLLGRRVAAEPNFSCRSCRSCLAGRPNVCPDYHVLGEGMEYAGGLAEYVAVPADGLHVVPDGVSMVDAAVVQPLAVSYHAVVDRAAVQGGETVLVIGAGPIGLGALLVARSSGARVIVADVRPERLRTASRLGASAVVDARAEDVDEVVAGVTDGHGVDVSIDAVGGRQHATIAQAQRATAPFGRIVLVGGVAAGDLPFPLRDLKNREQALLGSQGHPGTFAPVLRLIAEGRLCPADLVSHRFPLDRAASVLDALARPDSDHLKVVLEP